MFTTLISAAIWAGTAAVPEKRCTQGVLLRSNEQLASFSKLNYVSVRLNYSETTAEVGFG